MHWATRTSWESCVGASNSTWSKPSKPKKTQTWHPSRRLTKRLLPMKTKMKKSQPKTTTKRVKLKLSLMTSEA